MQSELVLKWGLIIGGIILVIVIIIACVAYFVGKRSARKVQGGMYQSQMMSGMPYQQNPVSYQQMNGAPYQQPTNGVHQPQPMNVRFCAQCGKQDMEGKAFCAFCGNQFMN